MSIAGALILLAIALIVLSGTVLVVVGGTRPRTPDIPKPEWNTSETTVAETAVAEQDGKLPIEDMIKQPFCQEMAKKYSAVYVGGAPLSKNPAEWTTEQKKAVLQIGDWVWVGNGEHRWRVKAMNETAVTLWRFAEGAVQLGERRKSITRSFPWELIRFSSHTGRRNNRKA